MTAMKAIHRALLPLMAAPLVLAAPARAQEPDREEPCVCAGELEGLARIFEMKDRARLGVMLGEPTEVDGRPAVRLEEVPDGTPAGRAGLRAGDAIVALDGDPLGSNPTGAILDRMSEREPGDTVELTFYRDGEERTARVVTDVAPDFGFWQDGPDAGIRVAPRIRFSGPADVRTEVLGPGFVYRQLLRDGLDLVAVNPRLGEYFGTDRGVLVTEIDEDSSLKLQPGDVILAIGGRQVRDPAHARSILSSYRDHEEITFRIVREQRSTEVTGRRDG